MHKFFHYCFLLAPVHKENTVVLWMGPGSLTQIVQSKAFFKFCLYKKYNYIQSGPEVLVPLLKMGKKYMGYKKVYNLTKMSF